MVFDYVAAKAAANVSDLSPTEITSEVLFSSNKLIFLLGCKRIGKAFVELAFHNWFLKIECFYFLTIYLFILFK